MENKAAGTLRVEVIYARPGNIWRREVELPSGATALQALQASGLLASHPDFHPGSEPPLGVYGRTGAPHQPLQAGDRVEVYRPLVFDPMESRRRRQRHRQRRKS
ncbi:MAG: RnfH family protein [Alcaligenaceae bacterium]|nr:RnfH family protein [Alcaligenaceae bacterium]